MIDIFGCDINSDFIFKDGDIELIDGVDNLAQAIVSRLNTDKGFYNDFYMNYGGNLSSIYGLENNSNALEYLRVEIEYILQQEPRIKDLNCKCSKENSQTVNVELEIIPINSNEQITLNLVVNEDFKVQIDNRGEEDGTNK